MKKLSYLPAALLLLSCEYPTINVDYNQPTSEQTAKTKKFTFTLKCDWDSPTFTRAYMTANGQELTDIFVFDVQNDSVVQSLHLTPIDQQWGVPVLHLTYGSHKVCFVASRGGGLAIDTAAHVLTWELPRDTFWKLYDVEVVGTSNGNRAVTLDRVATKLKVTVIDEVPVDMDSLTVHPTVWYYGLNYLTGDAAVATSKTRGVKVPTEYVGTAGLLSATFFGISPADEWTADVDVKALDEYGSVIGSATINSAPFKRNRSTEYTGLLFGMDGICDVSVSDEWEDASVGTW